MKQVIHNEDGTTTTEYAHPDACLAGVLRILRARVAEKLARNAPQHDQLNAALGLIDAEPITAAIQQARAEFAAARARAEAAHAAWDGSKSTADAASESIMAALGDP